MVSDPRLPPVEPDPIKGPILLRQRWRDVIFLHWAVDPEQVAPRLPSGTQPDVLDGETYVGVVAFRVPSTQVLGRVPIGPGVEVNTRVYSVDEEGRHGTVFLSLDMSRPDMALAGRVLGWLAYLWTDIDVVGEAADGTTGYRCRRKVPHEKLVSTVVVTRGPRLTEETTAFEHFVTARWFLHNPHPLGSYCLPVAHVRWPAHRAEIVDVDDVLVRAAGLTPRTVQPASALWSPGVNASIGRPGRISPRS